MHGFGKTWTPMTWDNAYTEREHINSESIIGETVCLSVCGELSKGVVLGVNPVAEYPIRIQIIENGYFSRIVTAKPTSIYR